jgi:hypothetical protein
VRDAVSPRAAVQLGGFFAPISSLTRLGPRRAAALWPRPVAGAGGKAGIARSPRGNAHKLTGLPLPPPRSTPRLTPPWTW